MPSRTSIDDPHWMTGRDLAELLGIAPSTLSEAAKYGRMVNGFTPTEWAERDSDGTVTGYLVPQWALDVLTAPPDEQDKLSVSSEFMRSSDLESLQTDESPLEIRDSARRSGVVMREREERSPERSPRRTPLPPPVETRGIPTEPVPPNAYPFAQPNVLTTQVPLRPTATQPLDGFDAQRQAYERVIERQEREMERMGTQHQVEIDRLREENQRLRDELRDERDRAHREKMETLAEQMKQEMKDFRERSKLREELIDMKGELRLAEGGVEQGGVLDHLMRAHGEKLIDAATNVAGAVAQFTGASAVNGPEFSNQEGLGATLQSSMLLPTEPRSNGSTELSQLDQLAAEVVQIVTHGSQEEITHAAQTVQGMIAPSARLPFARRVLEGSFSIDPASLAPRLRPVVETFVPVAFSFDPQEAVGFARSSGLVQSDEEARWLAELLMAIQASKAEPEVAEEVITAKPKSSDA